MSIDFIKTLYYELLSYFVVKKTRYNIEGNCIKCGNCCRNIYSFGLKNEKELKLMSFFIPYYRNFYIKSSDEDGNLILSCKHIQSDNLCAIYSKRPKICKNYPKKIVYKNVNMPDGCGYRVYKKEFKDYLN